MISFMVLGGPRSATTWAANAFTTHNTICLHDPLLEYSIEYLQRMHYPGRRMGIACTSACLYPEWINAQKCPKLVLYRDVVDINRSLKELGLVELIESRHLARLDAIEDAMWVPYEYLFSPTAAVQIFKHLRVPFDQIRYDIIRQMRIEPKYNHINVGRAAVTQLMQKIKESR